MLLLVLEHIRTGQFLSGVETFFCPFIIVYHGGLAGLGDHRTYQRMDVQTRYYILSLLGRERRKRLSKTVVEPTKNPIKVFEYTVFG